MIPRRPILVSGPLPTMDRHAAALVGHPVPYDPNLTVVNLVSYELVHNIFGGNDPDETHFMVMVDCKEGA